MNGPCSAVQPTVITLLVGTWLGILLLLEEITLYLASYWKNHLLQDAFQTKEPISSKFVLLRHSTAQHFTVLPLKKEVVITVDVEQEESVIVGQLSSQVCLLEMRIWWFWTTGPFCAGNVCSPLHTTFKSWCNCYNVSVQWKWQLLLLLSHKHLLEYQRSIPLLRILHCALCKV